MPAADGLGDQPHHLVGLAAGEAGVPDDEPGAVVVGGVGGERLDADPEREGPLGHREVVDAVGQPQHGVQAGVDPDDLELGQVAGQGRPQRLAPARVVPRRPREVPAQATGAHQLGQRARADAVDREPVPAQPLLHRRAAARGTTAQAIRSDGDRTFEEVPR